MSTATQEQPGKASAVPKTDEPIKFTTPEEVEKYETMLEKAFVRKDDPKGKEFFYRIVSLHPSQPSGHIGGECVLKFAVQKYYRNQFWTEEKDGQKIRRNHMVAQFDPGGKLLDSDAAFFIDCSKFCREFSSDN